MAAKPRRTDLVEMRKAAGLSQRELAITMGVTRGQIHSWERGTARLPLEDAFDLAEALGVTIEKIGDYGDMRPMALQTLGEFLEEAGYSLERVARLSGLSVSFLRIASGHCGIDLGPTALAKIAAGLRISYSELAAVVGAYDSSPPSRSWIP